MGNGKRQSLPPVNSGPGGGPAGKERLRVGHPRPSVATSWTSSPGCFSAVWYVLPGDGPAERSHFFEAPLVNTPRVVAPSKGAPIFETAFASALAVASVSRP